MRAAEIERSMRDVIKYGCEENILFSHIKIGDVETVFKKVWKFNGQTIVAETKLPNEEVVGRHPRNVVYQINQLLNKTIYKEMDKLLFSDEKKVENVPTG